jgi:hypothetical protein
MRLDATLVWLHDSPFGTFVRESTWAEPIVETIHVLTLGVFLGFVMLLDLRLLDLALRRTPVSTVFGHLNPWLFGSFAVMIVTGVTLFTGDPVLFYGTIFFKFKMVMLVAAAVNVLAFNVTAGRHLMQWDRLPATPRGAKITGLLSLLLWVGVVACGRGIAYVLPPP